MHKKIEERRLQTMWAHEQEMLDKYGWVVRYVFETDAHEFDGLANIYTKGLPESFGHPNIQVVLPLPQDIIHSVLLGMVESIKTGVVFESGVISDEVLRGMPVTFKTFKNNGKEVLRLLLPDPNGILPTDPSCQEAYKRQLEILPE